MRNTRREFLQGSAVLAMGAMSGRAAERALDGAQQQGPVAGQPSSIDQGWPAADVQVPKMKFGSVEIGRLVLGGNPFNGYSHFNGTLSGLMVDWYTPDRVCAAMHRANQFGINAYNYSLKGKSSAAFERFEAEGGKLHLIVADQGEEEPANTVKNLKPHAMYRQGEVVDVAFRNGKMDQVRDWCKRTRDTGAMVGVGTHKSEVIACVEEQGWDVDFYAGCVYNRTRTDEEWRKILNGELMEMSREIYIQSDPARMYKVMRQTPKPCFAFKILAAGRIGDGGIAQAFRTAFTSIKPNDGVFVGIFAKDKDQIKQNAEIVHGILTAG